MTDTTDSSKDCTCGGCGTGTACANDPITLNTNKYVKPGVYLYASLGPDDRLPEISTTTPDTITWPPGTPDDVQMRAMLQDEIIKDLLERVQKLEQDIKALREDNLELLGSLTAISDILEDEAAKGPRSIVDVLLGNRR